MRQNNGDVLKVEFQKIKGHLCPAPFVDVRVENTSFETSEVFKMRVDTGADITCLPACMVKGMKFSNLRKMRIARRNGGCVQYQAKDAIVFIQNGDSVWRFRPEDGVLIFNAEYGLLGVDILNRLVVKIDEGVLTLTRRQ